MTVKQKAAELQLRVLFQQSSISKSYEEEWLESNEADLDTAFQAVEIEQLYYADPIVTVKQGIIDSAIADWKEVPVLMMCFLFDVLGAANDPEGTRLFERAVKHALKRWIHHEVFDNSAISGKGFRDRVISLSEATSLNQLKVPDSRYKDDRVDLIVHTSFLDKRSANLYVLMQCAAGKRWAEKKQISLDRWAQYLDWPRTSLSAAISTAQFIEESGNWTDLSTDYGMLMDRVRLQRAYSSGESGLNEELIAWVEGKMSELS